MVLQIRAQMRGDGRQLVVRQLRKVLARHLTRAEERKARRFQPKAAVQREPDIAVEGRVVRRQIVDAFEVARELVAAGIPVRWCDTHGEQCHAKLMLRRGNDGSVELIAGSANYTRRNLDDYNLESSARILAARDAPVARQASAYFEQSWNNGDGRRISLPYSAYEDTSRWRYWRYRFAEATGLSSF